MHWKKKLRKQREVAMKMGQNRRDDDDSDGDDNDGDDPQRQAYTLHIQLGVWSIRRAYRQL